MYKLLLVDDEAVVRLGVKSCVDWASLDIGQIYEASNGQEALDIVNANSIDIMIIDIRMSVMDGLTLLERLESSPVKPKTIVMSCYNDYDNMRQAMRHGAMDFLFKPRMYPADIEAAIRRVIETISPSQGALSAFVEEVELMDEGNYREALARLRDIVVGEPPCEEDEAVRLSMVFLGRLAILDDRQSPEIAALARKLAESIREAKNGLGLAAVKGFLERAVKKESPERRDPAHDAVAKALDYIENNLSNPNLSQELVSDEAGLSVSYFSRLFKSAVGQSYSDYVIGRRIKLADELCREGMLSVGEIAGRVGYSNERYFAKLFKQQTGVSLNKARFGGKDLS